LESEFDGSKYPSLTAGATNNGNASTNSSIQTLAKDIENINGVTAPSVQIYATSTTANAYAIRSTLNGGGYVCFDSVGNASTSYSGSQWSSNAICK